MFRCPSAFRCPITGDIFSDPVMLETGSTYDREVIQEWLKVNNSDPTNGKVESLNQLPDNC